MEPLLLLDVAGLKMRHRHGLPSIERVKGHHTTVIAKQGEKLARCLWPRHNSRSMWTDELKPYRCQKTRSAPDGGWPLNQEFRLALGDHSAKTLNRCGKSLEPGSAISMSSWLECLSGFISTRRPDGKQDSIWHEWKEKHTLAPLPSATAPQNALLFALQENAEALNSIATALFFLRCSSSSVISFIQQRRMISGLRCQTLSPLFFPSFLRQFIAESL